MVLISLRGMEFKRMLFCSSCSGDEWYGIFADKTAGFLFGWAGRELFMTEIGRRKVLHAFTILDRAFAVFKESSTTEQSQFRMPWCLFFIFCYLTASGLLPDTYGHKQHLFSYVFEQLETSTFSVTVLSGRPMIRLCTLYVIVVLLSRLLFHNKQ